MNSVIPPRHQQNDDVPAPFKTLNVRAVSVRLQHTRNFMHSGASPNADRSRYEFRSELTYVLIIEAHMNIRRGPLVLFR
jgi:hypothetical protein